MRTIRPDATFWQVTSSRISAVLGPTNTGKTHLAIERMCAHSSGAIGFPLRLLAREVYDRVCQIKNPKEVALITGEERIEPPNARWLLCTAEAMPRDGGGRAFVALDEAQLAANPERGHIFTDRLLHARGRDETMLLGSATLAPLVRQLVPEAEMVERPRFSTLSHAGACKLSRLPPRSAIVAFSAEQVYAVAEMLRRFRGGAAVVMGALSPATRNAQVELFQSGEVDYIVATDAIGMGLNLDVYHVAFAGLSKFDGSRQRRLIPAEMAQIAGRAGRHQTDGTFGTLARGDRSPEFTEEEVYALEEHQFAPLTHLYWRNAKPRFNSLSTLIGDLEQKPRDPALRAAPEAIDLTVLKRLAEDPSLRAAVSGADQVRRFWQACQLPDFRQLGVEAHARLVARIWRDLQHGFLGADFVAARIAQLDNVQGDIDTLQGRIAAIRIWAYAAQRPDWVLARDEMAARARAVEAKLSDALHGRLSERFVNRRTAVLMKSLGKDARLLRVELDDDESVSVEGEIIGRLDGFRFRVDPVAGHRDRKLLLAAAEKHLPRLLASKARKMTEEELGELKLAKGAIWRGDDLVARLSSGKTKSRPVVTLDKALAQLPDGDRAKLQTELENWLEAKLEPLEPLRKLEEAVQDAALSSELRAVLVGVVEGNGYAVRDNSGLKHLTPDHRKDLWRNGVNIGTLDLFAPALLKPAPRTLLHAIGADPRPLEEDMQSVKQGGDTPPAGYRRAGGQFIRLDVAEKILRAAHETRGSDMKRFRIDLALGISVGLTETNLLALLRDGGFRPWPYLALEEAAFGPAAPRMFSWRTPEASRDGSHRRDGEHARKRGNKKKRGGPKNKGAGQNRPANKCPREVRNPEHSAFAGLADLMKDKS